MLQKRHHKRNHDRTPARLSLPRRVLPRVKLSIQDGIFLHFVHRKEQTGRDDAGLPEGQFEERRRLHSLVLQNQGKSGALLFLCHSSGADSAADRLTREKKEKNI